MSRGEGLGGGCPGREIEDWELVRAGLGARPLLARGLQLPNGGRPAQQWKEGNAEQPRPGCMPDWMILGFEWLWEKFLLGWRDVHIT